MAAAKAVLRPRTAPLPPRADVRRIVLVKLWAIGEYLMATPAFAALRELYPQAEITLLTGVAAAPLAAAAPTFDRVWTVPEELFVERRVRELRRLRERLAAENADLAVVFHLAWEFSAFAAWAGVPHRVGFDRDGDGFAHTVKVPRIGAGTRWRNTSTSPAPAAPPASRGRWRSCRATKREPRPSIS